MIVMLWLLVLLFLETVKEQRLVSNERPDITGTTQLLWMFIGNTYDQRKTISGGGKREPFED